MGKLINENLNIKLPSVRCSIFSFYSYCDMNWFAWIEFQMIGFPLVNCWTHLYFSFMEISHVYERQGYSNCLFICLMSHVLVALFQSSFEYSIHFYSAQINIHTLTHSLTNTQRRRCAQSIHTICMQYYLVSG